MSCNKDDEIDMILVDWDNVTLNMVPKRDVLLVDKNGNILEKLCLETSEILKLYKKYPKAKKECI